MLSVRSNVYPRLRFGPSLVALVAVLLVSVVVYQCNRLGDGTTILSLQYFNNLYTVMLARFFRDVSRYKARKRLFSNSNTSLIHIVLGNFNHHSLLCGSLQLRNTRQ